MNEPLIIEPESYHLGWEECRAHMNGEPLLLPTYVWLCIIVGVLGMHALTVVVVLKIAGVI